MILSAQHAAARWYDRREAVFVEFCVEDSQNVQINFDTSKLDFRSVPFTAQALDFDFIIQSAWTVIGLNSWLFCCLFVWCSCVSKTADKKLQNTVDLFSEINPKVCVTYSVVNCICAIFFYNLSKGFIKSSVQESKHKRTDRSVLCCLRKAQPGISWLRLTKLKEKVIGVFLWEKQKILKSLILLPISLWRIILNTAFC